MLTLRRRGSTVMLCGPEGCYSRYHPRQPFTGMGWDAQSAASLLAGAPPSRVLLLGLGGGTVARQIRLMFPLSEITAVEIDPVVLGVARSGFELGKLDLRAVNSSGEAFVARSRRQFDLIIDDMWDHEGRRPRSACSDSSWPAVVAQRLTPGGVFAANLYSRTSNPEDYAFALASLRRAYCAVWELRLPREPVTVLAGLRRFPRRGARHRLMATLPPAAQNAIRSVVFRDRTRRVGPTRCSPTRSAS